MSTQSFAAPVDSVDCSEDFIAVGLSNLEGNVWDGELKLLSFVSGEVEQSAKFDTGVTRVRFIGNDSTLVATRDNGSISLHKVSDLSEAFLINEAHDDCVSAVTADAFASHMFITAGWDGAIRLWDMESSDLMKPILSLEDAHQSHINDVAISRTGSTAHNVFASVGQDGFLRLWDQRAGLKNGCTQIHSVKQAASCVEWDNHYEHQLYIGTDSGTVISYDIRQNKNVEAPCGVQLHKGRVRRICSVKQTANLIVTASDDCAVVVSEITSGVEGSSKQRGGYPISCISR